MPSKPLPWMTIYPTISAVQSASFETVAAWYEHLPPPQTDVEHAVRRRIAKRINDDFMPELRKQAPDVADQLDNILKRFEKVTGHRSPPVAWR